MNFKSMITLALILLSPISSADEWSLVGSKIDKSGFYQQFYDHDSVKYDVMIGSRLRLTSSVSDIKYEGNEAGGILTVLVSVNSINSNALYSNLVNVKVGLSHLDINWAKGEFNLSNGRILSIVEQNSFSLRNEINEYVRQHIVRDYVERILVGLTFEMSNDDMRSMNSQAKYYLKASDGSIFISL